MDPRGDSRLAQSAGEVNMPQVDNERGQNEKQIERYSEMQK